MVNRILHINGHFLVAGLTSDPKKRYMTLICAYTHPFSRGTVHIKSKDAEVRPAIQPNYLSNPADLEILTKSVDLALRLYQTKPLMDQVVGPVVPTFTAEDASEEALRDYVKQMLSTVHHPVGTASMLPREYGGVVDDKLLVYGTSNLRIVCSILLSVAHLTDCPIG